MSSLDSPNLQFCYIILYVKFHLPGFKFALRPEGKRAKFHLYTVFYNRTALHSVRGCLSMWSTHNRNTCIVLDIGYFVLHFILCGNVFPCGQKYPFIHLSVLHKQHMHRHLAAESKTHLCCFWWPPKRKEHVLSHRQKSFLLCWKRWWFSGEVLGIAVKEILGSRPSLPIPTSEIDYFKSWYNRNSVEAIKIFKQPILLCHSSVHEINIISGICVPSTVSTTWASIGMTNI